MELKMIRVPFDIEKAKRISEGKLKGKIITRDGRNARIICWDRKSKDYPLVALHTDDDEEDCDTYTISGVYTKYKDNHNNDLFLEIPECLTFADGEVVVQSFKRDNGEHCEWVSIVKDADVWEGGDIVTHDYFSVCIDADDNNKFAPCFGGISNAATDIRKADDSEKEIVINTLKKSKDERAKDYLKRFFGIEQKDEPKFNPFGKVLCRNSTGVWFADFFSHIGEDGRFCCIGGFWKHCIPYEGNEHLLGTTDDYKEE